MVDQMIVHFNNELVPAESVRISPFDRGFLFAHSVYEGMRAEAGQVLHLHHHVDRLNRSMLAARISGYDADRLREEVPALLEAAALEDAFIYWQVTGGSPAPGAPVRQRVPELGTMPTVFGYAIPATPLRDMGEPTSVSAVTGPDLRRTRVDIKSTSLLSNVMGACEASEAQADDTIFIRETATARGAVHRVAEATASNVFLVVDGEGGDELVTPSLDSTPMLEGVTRKVIIEQLRASGVHVAERPVAALELNDASEIITAGTHSAVRSVTTLDGDPVGAGQPGPFAQMMLNALQDASQALA